MTDTQTILVTGAGSGIGRSTARVFVEAGWRVALLGRRAVALEETAAGHPALILPCDVGDPEAVDAAFAQVSTVWGKLDVLFNNAGMSLPAAPIDEVPVEDWLALERVNITGMVLCARAAFGLMRRQTPQGGRIINNGSISAHTPRPNAVAYTATKHAMTGLTKAISLEGRAYDVACGQIDIGNAATDMTAAMAQGVLQADGSTAAEPRMDARHVADAVLYMAGLPLDANVQFLTITATKMPFVGRG